MAGGCATHERLPLPPGLMELEGAVEEEPAVRGYLGAEVLPNESESLENLEIRPGLRVSRVAPGSPADKAGLRASDVLLRFDGAPTDDRERLEALLLGVQEPRTVSLQVQRGTRVWEVPVELEVREGGGPGHTLYHIERGRLRAAFRDTHDDGAYPEVARLAEDSPLRAAGVREGDRVLRFQGQDPGSAQELVRRAAFTLEPGAQGSLRVRHADGAEEDIQFRAWEPERVLTGVTLWPVYVWDYDLETDRVELVVGDFFLFSLFKRVHQGTESHYSILSLIRWDTGEPTLERVGGAAAQGTEP